MSSTERVEDECFGIPRGGTVVGLAIGIIIILVGSVWFLQQADLISQDVNVWPFAVIIFGILIFCVYKLLALNLSKSPTL